MICTMNFFSLYRFSLFQYHEPLFQYHEPKTTLLPMVFLDGVIWTNHYPIQWVNTMVVTPGFALYERFYPYATWHVVFRVHMRLLLDKSAYALRHTLFTIDLAHAEFISSFPSVLTIDTSDLVHQDIIKHNFIK